MVGSSDGNIIVNYRKCPCAKGVQTNTFVCTVCKRCIRKRYSGVGGSLSLVVDGFMCNRCEGRSPISHWRLHQCS